MAESHPPFVVAGAGQLYVYYLMGSSTLMENVLGIDVGSMTFSQANANTLDTAIKTSFTSTIGPSIHPSVTLVAVGIRSITTAAQPEFRGVGAAVPGTGTGDALPRGVAFVVSLRTSLAGQRYRGRVYLGGFAESVNDADATAASTIATQAVNFVTGIDSALQGLGGHLAVVSHPEYARTETVNIEIPGGGTETHTKVSVARPGTFTRVTAIVARNDLWDSQRNRSAPGGGSTLFIQPTAGWSREDGQMVTNTSKRSRASSSNT